MAEHIFSGSDFTARSTSIAGEDAFHYIWIAEDGAFVAKKVGTAGTNTDAVSPMGYRRLASPADTTGVVDGDYENVQGSDGAVWVMQRPTVSAGAKQTLSVTTSVQTLVPPAGSRYALMSLESQPVRWWDDGTVPTGTSGHFWTPGLSLEYDGPLAAFKVIRDTTATANATLNITFYK